MKVLVINSGSSSIKYKLFENETQIYHGIKEEVKSHHDALEELFEELNHIEQIDSLEDIDAIGHRVVHGGEKFDKPALVDDEVIKDIEELIPLAPLHNPANLEAIVIIKEKYPHIPQIAVFDTAFHQSIPPENYIYPINKNFYDKNHIRKYGFHGTSHYHVARKAARFLDKSMDECNFITFHIGNGSSVTAVKKGKSVDTSMGFTPLAGLMMGTRSGDIDPSIIFYLEKMLGYKIEDIDTLLNKDSGLKGICGESDLRTVLEHMRSGDKTAKLAVDMFVKKIRDFVGSYIVELGTVDAMIFTGGIGENSSYIREKVCENLYDSIGLTVDTYRDEHLKKPIDDITGENSRVRVLVVQTNEEKSIALQTMELLKKQS